MDSDQSCDSADLAGETGQLVGDYCSRYQLSMMTADLLLGLIVTELQHHFSSLSFIQDPAFRKARYLWGGVDATTGILIESIYRWTPERTNQRPAFLVGFGGMQRTRLLLGDRRETDTEGNEQFSTWWRGSHFVVALGGMGQEALCLGLEAERELTGFAPVLLRDLHEGGLRRIQPTQLGPPMQIKESKEHYGCVLSVEWALEEAWVSVQQARPMRKVLLSQLIGF